MADVKSNAFMLSSATLMIAPAFTTDVFSLTPGMHSVGMAREITCAVDASAIELLNGIAQVVVDSKRTGVKSTITASLYEFTAQNLLRSLSLNNTSVTVKRGKLDAPLAADAVSLTVVSDPVPGDATSSITAIGDIPSGSTLLIQRPGGEVDYVFPTKSTGAATNGTGKYTVPIADDYKIPTGMSFPKDSLVWIVSPIPVGSIDEAGLFGVKITGTLSNFDRPVTAVFPKVKIIKGFNLSYSETDYGSLPFEMQPLLLSGGEATGRLADIGLRAPGAVYVGA